MPDITRLPRSVLLLALTSFFADVSSEMGYPVLPLFLTQQLNAPGSAVGAVEGVAEATQHIVQGGSGWVADHMRQNKPLALLGYTLGALAKPTIGFSAVWQQVLGARLADRLGTGIRSAPRDALLASSVSSERRGAAFGLEGVGDNFGAVVGPLLAAALLFAVHLDMRWIFYLAFIPGILAVAVMSAVPERRRTPPSEDSPRLSLRDLPASYWKYVLAVAVFSLGNSSNAFIILKGSSVGIPTEANVLIYAGFNFVAAAASYPAGALSDRIGRKTVFLVGLGIFAAAYVGLALANQALAVGALFVVYGAYQGIFRAVGKALATDLAPPDLRGSGIGLYLSAVGASTLVASLVGGQLWDRVGPVATFAYGAGLAILGGALLAALVPGSQSERQPASAR